MYLPSCLKPEVIESALIASKPEVIADLAFPVAPAAERAIEKSKNPDIISFAQEMERDHKAVNDQALALVKKLGVKPEDNPTSQTLNKNAKAELAALEKLRGSAFDKAYIDNEVAYHKAVDAALSTTLIPSAHNAELKALLQQGLTLFTEHLKHAEMVAGEIK